MKIKNKIWITGICILLALTLQNSQADDENKQDVEVILMENTDNLIKIKFEVNNFDMHPLIINGKECYSIRLEDEPNIIKKGYPSLPKICRSIIIPDDKKMEIRIKGYEYTEYENVLIEPSKGLIFRNINPDNVSYEFGEIYQKDEWYPNIIAELREPYILRDFRGQVVEVHPFQYNANQKKLRVYNEIVVEIYPVGKGEVNVFERQRSLEKIDSEFKRIYERHFINFDKIIGRYTPVDEVGNILIICYDSFYSTMKPFVTWKNMKGIPTEMVNLSDVGSTANDIKNYIINYYNTNGLTFVLLVGDIQQIPSLYYNGYAASDPSYTYVVGNDHYPDLFIGRFSAQTVSQLETQVNRSIEYEKNPQSGANWYHKGVGVASSQGPGDDGEYDYQHVRNIRAKLLNYTYTYVDEFYDGSQGGGDAGGNPTPTMISNALNDGRSILNYCGHGSASSWGTSGFSNSHINSLVNDNMLPYVINVACNNGQFDDYNECFCEAWLRATDSSNGEPTGAIVATGSSKSMAWDPPMDAQDEMNDILVESYANNIKHTIGGIHYNGCMHMNDNYGSSGYAETDTWIFFGDPSIEIRTDTPSNMTVVHSPVIPIGSLSYSVSVPGIEDALCALSRNGELLAYNYTDANGNATLYFDNPIDFVGTVDLYVTAYNKMPYNATIYVSASENIGVMSLEVNKYAIPNKILYVNATIMNSGSVNETNIIVSFRVNGTELDSITIPFMESQTSQDVSFTWIPSRGWYNVVVNATISGVIENFTSDNEKSKRVIVGADIEVSSMNVSDAVTGVISEIDAIVNNLGLTNEIVTVSLIVNDSLEDEVEIFVPSRSSQPITLLWNPLYEGNYEITVEARAKAEAYSGNDHMRKTINVTALANSNPDIYINPLNFYYVTWQNFTLNDSFIIGNNVNASTDLTFQITYTADWLSISPQNGSISPGNEVNISITIDTSNLTTGVTSTFITLIT
ncbi:MAG TPA: hypothetical protein ENI53_02105, partial [Thermoplasmatales archaeon]|nr:hypothetical protein [Thermoplasmatales archaeon]